MKQLNWVTTSESHAYMRMRQDQNLRAALSNENENWMADLLGAEWKRQAIWGKRIFDFWNALLGIAIEVDGTEHDSEYDCYRDEYSFRRSGIVVLRVRNGNAEDAEKAIRFVKSADLWSVRKERLGIAGDTKAIRRSLAILPYPPSLLQKFVTEGASWL
jgi:very-short-patch-repair endonuclease